MVVKQGELVLPESQREVVTCSLRNMIRAQIAFSMSYLHEHHAPVKRNVHAKTHLHGYQSTGLRPTALPLDLKLLEGPAIAAGEESVAKWFAVS